MTDTQVINALARLATQWKEAQEKEQKLLKKHCKFYQEGQAVPKIFGVGDTFKKWLSTLDKNVAEEIEEANTQVLFSCFAFAKFIQTAFPELLTIEIPNIDTTSELTV